MACPEITDAEMPELPGTEMTRPEMKGVQIANLPGLQLTPGIGTVTRHGLGALLEMTELEPGIGPGLELGHSWCC